MSKVISFGKETLDSKKFFICAGPCAIESEELFKKQVSFLKSSGIKAIRGGIYKLRTNPASFQGLRQKAQVFVKKLKQEMDFSFATEVTDPRQIESLNEIADVFQVGARNMFNYDLLKELGKWDKPVLLKRGFSARIKEWLLAADYLAGEGNENVILCERGIRTFETYTRNTLDLSAVAVVKKISPWPVFVDPSHGVGLSDFIAPLSKAALAAGADGLLLETHPNPSEALCDGQQALTFEKFSELLCDLKKIARVFGREV